MILKLNNLLDYRDLLDIGNFLRKIRHENGYSQQYISNCLDISREAYRKWEENRINFSILQLMKIASIYDLNITEIIEKSIVKKIPVNKKVQDLNYAPKP